MSENVQVAATIKVGDQASAPIRGITASMERMKATAVSLAASFRAIPGVQRLQRSFAGLGASLANVRTSVNSAMRPLMGLAGLAGTISLGGLYSGLREYISQTAGLLGASRAVGTTVEQLSALEISAHRFGIDADTLVSGFTRAGRSMNEAASGKNRNFAGLMRAMGVSVRGAHGEMRNFIDILPQVADRFAATQSASTRGRIAIALFGREMGPRMIPLLAQGRAGLDRLMEEARKLGVVTQQQAEEAKAFRDAQKDVGETLDAVGRSIYATLLPAIKPFLDIVRQLLTENRKDIIDVFRSFGETLKGIDIKAFAQDVLTFGKAILAIFRAMGGFYYIGLRVAWMLAGPFVKAILAVGQAVFGLARGFLILLGVNPILAGILAAIMLLAAAAYIIYQNWDKIGPAFWRIWAYVKQAFDVAWRWLKDFLAKWTPEPIKQAWDGLTTFFSTLFGKIWNEGFASALTYLATFIAQFIPEPIRQAWDVVAGWFTAVWDQVKAPFWAALDWLATFVGQFIPEPIKKYWDLLATFYSTLFSKIWNEGFAAALAWLPTFVTEFAPKALMDIWNSLPAFFTRIWDGVKKAFADAWAYIEPIVHAVEVAAEKIVSLGRTIANVVSNAPALEAGLDAGGIIPPRAALPGGAPPAATVPQAATAAGVPGIVGAATQAQRPAEVTGKIRIEGQINAPAGSTITTTTEGQNVAPPQVNVGQSMPLVGMGQP